MSLQSIKKETGITLKTIDQNWSLQRWQKFLKTSLGANVGTFRY